jgi:hypothetical protein
MVISPGARRAVSCTNKCSARYVHHAYGLSLRTFPAIPMPKSSFVSHSRIVMGFRRRAMSSAWSRFITTIRLSAYGNRSSTIASLCDQTQISQVTSRLNRRVEPTRDVGRWIYGLMCTCSADGSRAVKGVPPAMRVLCVVTPNERFHSRGIRTVPAADRSKLEQRSPGRVWFPVHTDLGPI